MNPTEPTAASTVDLSDAWGAFAEQLRVAGERLSSVSADLEPIERADGYRALLRAVNNQLGRFETDRERPELVAFNGWREKFLMDNPDFRYWVADIRDDRRYRITGSMTGAVYASLTAYASSGVLDATVNARLDSDQFRVGDDDTFHVTVSSARPEGDGPWLQLPTGARSIWLRMFYDTPGDGPMDRSSNEGASNADEPWCRIEPLDSLEVPPVIEPTRFAEQLARAGKYVAQWPRIVENAIATDLASTNSVRHWSEMTGGAAFTEPGIHYLRGSWELEQDEALVVEGLPPACRYWNILLYSRFLNSLDHRHRRVSRTRASSHIVDGQYRYVLAARDPGDENGDWLDTEGRRFGIFVLRFLHPKHAPELPIVRRVSIGEIETRA